jgi:hypothetical protein
MPSVWDRVNPGLGSDENGNQYTWPSYGVNPNQPAGYGSLGGYQQPGGGWNPSPLNWTTIVNPNLNPQNPYANQPPSVMSGSYNPYYGQPPASLGWNNPYANQPRASITNQPVRPGQPNSFGQYNPQVPNNGWVQQGNQSAQNVQNKNFLLSNGPAFSKVPPSMIGKQSGIPNAPDSRMNYAQGKPYSMTTSPTGGKPYGMTYSPSQTTGSKPYTMQYSGANGQKYNMTFSSAYKNPLANQLIDKAKQAISYYNGLNEDMKSQLALKYQQAQQPQSTGGGGGYPYYYGGGGGYSYTKRAEALPGAVWRMNQ